MTEASPVGFHLSTRGPFQVRDYSNDALADLEPVYALVDALVEQHKILIPGSMNRLMRQWRNDLRIAIAAKKGDQTPADDDEYDDGPDDRYMEIGVAK
jgi:hypothetical protein